MEAGKVKFYCYVSRLSQPPSNAAIERDMETDMTSPFTLAKHLQRFGTSTILAAIVLAGTAAVADTRADSRYTKRNFNIAATAQTVAAKPAKLELSAVVAAPEVQGFTRGKIVAYTRSQPAGTIIVNTNAKQLYYVLGNGTAVLYPIATAKPGFEWSGSHKVSRKVKWPDWRPPASMRKRNPELPAFMAGGPNNPLGARAIYLGSSIYRIHGTNAPSSIGRSASSGCIRMFNADVEELYRHIKIGASVIVI
jgi:lipoprotein-anchoring transpeptidase ErfK/SrfK